MGNNQAELVFIPAPGIGHLISTVQLAKLLLQTNQAISISIFVITLPTQSSKLSAFVESESRDNLYSARLVFVSLPTPTNLPDPSVYTYFPTVIEMHKPLIKDVFDERVRVGSAMPVGFVVDMFCTVFVDIADELRLPSYLYCTSGASMLNFMFWAETWADDHGLQPREFAAKVSDPDCSFIVPGFKNPVTNKSIPSFFQREMGSAVFLNMARQFRRVKGILVNSYVELEPIAFQSLQNDKNVPPVYPVGPIIEFNSENGSQDKEKESIMRWLDDQPESSVVFLCFGSGGTFDEEQVKEIANGLDRSGHRFLWALRSPPAPGKPGSPIANGAYLEALPEGFLDQTGERGKVIGWAPQVEVLAHPAVGGFVSHCGWNSILESLWFNVPIGAWPLYVEQTLNALELVKDLEIAIDIGMDYSTNLRNGKEKFGVKAMEIEEGVKKLMSMDVKMKGNVKEMSDNARKALQIGGSSYHSIGSFIEEVFNNIV